MATLGLALGLIGIGLFSASIMLRGPWRIRTARIASPIVFLAVALLSLGLLRDDRGDFAGALSAASDYVALTGAIATFALGFGSRTISRMSGRPTIAVVIASRAPFFRELRHGLRQGLAAIDHDISDEFDSSRVPYEDLTGFVRCLRSALESKPDFVIVAAPAKSAYEDFEVSQLLQHHLTLGGVIVTIENPPDISFGRGDRRVHTLRSDSETGAKLLAHQAKQMVDGHEVVVLIGGPEDSEPARLRQQALEQALPNAKVHSLAVSNWSPAGAARVARKELESTEVRLFVCANDDMAISVSRLLQTTGVRDASVIGYDGLSQAIFAISDPGNPMAATVRIPPIAYGERAAARICLMTHLFGNRNMLKDSLIPIGPANLVTEDNVTVFLEGAT